MMIKALLEGEIDVFDERKDETELEQRGPDKKKQLTVI